jgi:hypothetical protein
MACDRADHMGQISKRIVLAGAVASALLFSDVSWARRNVRAEPAMKHAAASKCPADLEAEIARRLERPGRARELITIVSERGVDYGRRFIPMGAEVREYLDMTLRSKDKERRLLKKAREIERGYRDSVKDAITSSALESDPEAGKKVFGMLLSCRYIDSRSMLDSVEKQIASGAQRPENFPEGQDPRFWRVAKPEENPLPKAVAEEKKKQSDIDELFESGKESVKEKR